MRVGSRASLLDNTKVTMSFGVALEVLTATLWSVEAKVGISVVASDLSLI